jgi:hypothetical protein
MKYSEIHKAYRAAREAAITCRTMCRPEDEQALALATEELRRLVVASYADPAADLREAVKDMPTGLAANYRDIMDEAHHARWDLIHDAIAAGESLAEVHLRLDFCRRSLERFAAAYRRWAERRGKVEFSTGRVRRRLVG